MFVNAFKFHPSLIFVGKTIA